MSSSSTALVQLADPARSRSRTGGDGARPLITYLLSSASEVSYLRVVDRYFILPQASPIPSTTYLDADLREALSRGAKEGKLEYLQGNLLTEGESRSWCTCCL